MKIRIGNLEVLEGGVFLVPSGEIAEIDLSDGQGTMKLLFEFLADESGKANAETILGDTPDTLRIKLTNWGNPLGTTFIKPIQIGTYASRELHLIISVSRIGALADVREVIYTFFLGGAVNG